jgi:hypothetical protein
MFEGILGERDASRATSVAGRLIAHRFRIALTGRLAVEAQLRASGRPPERRPLNDIDFVVDGFETIPPAVAADFLPHHVHPFARNGKTLLQLIDPDRALRIDLFGAVGATLSRSIPLGGDTDPLHVVAVEDLVARTTAHVCAALRRRRPLETKHADAFRRLSGLGRPERLDQAWDDHRESLPMSAAEAIDEASRLLELHPELLVDLPYSPVVTACERCQSYGPFRPSDPQVIVRILGYC